MIALIERAREFKRERDALAAQADGRGDLRAIANLIAPSTRVLDIGCGDGALMALLEEEKGVDARGMELEQRNVNAAVARGLSVVQGDADTDLTAYPDDGFDTVILSRTIQATRAPDKVLREMLRVGRRVIVSFPNFGYWRFRGQLMFGGHMPVTEFLDYTWYETPNIHFCTVTDFLDLCDTVGARVERAIAFNGQGREMRFGREALESVAKAGAGRRGVPLWFINLIAEQAVMVLSREDASVEAKRAP